MKKDVMDDKQKTVLSHTLYYPSVCTCVRRDFLVHLVH